MLSFRPAILVFALVSLASCKGDKGDKPAGDETAGKVATGDKTEPATKPETKPKGVPPAYRKALREGRALVKDGKYAEGADKFREALKVVADDPRANSELSLALYLAGDYAGAQKAAEASVAKATSKVKAASLYNLGLALEKQGKKAEAIDAFRKSIAMRPHEVVAKKLAKLTGSTDLEPLAPAEWQGPFATIEEVCKSAADNSYPEDFRCPGNKRPAKLADGGPFAEVVDLELNKENHAGIVVIKTADGYFSSPVYYEHIVPGMYGAIGKIERAEVAKRGGADVLRLDMSINEDARFGTIAASFTWFCGISGKALKCTPKIFSSVDITEFDPFDEDMDETQNSYKFTLEVDDAGVLTVSAKGKVGGDYRAQLGKHTLSF